MTPHDLDLFDITPNLTKVEAIRLFVDNPSLNNLGVRGLSCDIDQNDRIVWWCADVFDPYADDDDIIGFASFAEHCPVVDIDWS
jgi:hypothetical protein